MYARWIRRGCSCINHLKGPRLVGEQRVGIGQTIVKILIMDIAMKNCDGALFTKLETRIRRYVIALEVIVSSDCGKIVLARVGAGYIEPVAYHIYWLTEIDRDGIVVGSISSIADRIRAGDPG